MKRILMRAGMLPCDDYPVIDILMNNRMSDNIGNLLYQYSVYNALKLRDNKIERKSFTDPVLDREIRKINENYDFVVLPLANAFRKSFIYYLNILTDFTNKLKIPCYVVGIGAQAPLHGDIDNAELDESVKKFMKAILKKSNIVGVRGEFTADYLQKLGFVPERDFTVIGCPSMFLYGETLPEINVKELTPKSSISLNSKISLPDNFHSFMHDITKKIPDYKYVPQVIDEIFSMYLGRPFKEEIKKNPKYFPVSPIDNLYASGRGISFVNVPSWLNYLRTRDFCIGSRIHGNIAGVLAGIPSFVCVSDKRIMELVKYHNIPNISMDEISKNTNIFDLFEKTDFTTIYKGHTKRFEKYVDFLKVNEIPNIFSENKSGKNPYFNLQMKDKEILKPLTPFWCENVTEQYNRMQELYKKYDKKIAKYKNREWGVKEVIKNKVKLWHKNKVKLWQKLDS